VIYAVVRDYDGQVFFREFDGGMLCSGYPPIAKPAYVDEIPEDLKAHRLPEDWDYFSKSLTMCFDNRVVFKAHTLVLGISVASP